MGRVGGGPAWGDGRGDRHHRQQQPVQASPDSQCPRCGRRQRRQRAPPERHQQASGGQGRQDVSRQFGGRGREEADDHHQPEQQEQGQFQAWIRRRPPPLSPAPEAQGGDRRRQEQRPGQQQQQHPGQIEPGGTWVPVKHAGEALDVAEPEEALHEHGAVRLGGRHVPGQADAREQQRHRQQGSRAPPVTPLAGEAQEDHDHQAGQQQAHRSLGQHRDGAEQRETDPAQARRQRLVTPAMGQQEGEQGQGDGAGEEHVGGGHPSPADPAGTCGQHSGRQQPPPEALAHRFSGRGPGQHQPESAAHHRAGGEGRGQPRCPLADAEQPEGAHHHPVAPDRVVEEALAVPPGGHPVVALEHFARHLDEQGLGLVGQTQDSQAVEEGEPAEQQQDGDCRQGGGPEAGGTTGLQRGALHEPAKCGGRGNLGRHPQPGWRATERVDPFEGPGADFGGLQRLLIAGSCLLVAGGSSPVQGLFQTKREEAA